MIIETYSGKRIDLTKPKCKDICIEDIAHSLSLQCRFNGHCSEFYSVANHCLVVVKIMEEKIKIKDKGLLLAGLLHDAEEAYTGDIIKPIKSMAILVAENRVKNTIKDKFNLRENYSIKLADNIALATESYYLMKSKGEWWDLNESPIINDFIFSVSTSSGSKINFLNKFKELTSAN